MKLLIVGAGGYGHHAEGIAELIEEYERRDFLDDAYSNAGGKLSELEDIQQNYNACIVIIGDPEIRERLFYVIKNCATLTHPKVVIGKSASIGHGCVLEANACINANAVATDGAVLPKGTK